MTCRTARRKTMQSVISMNEQDAQLPNGSPGEQPPADSQPDKANVTDTNPSPEGENTPAQDTVPFHKDPRWKEREDNWNKRFNDQEARHQTDLQKFREEFGAKAPKPDVDVPVWFGGDKTQWEAYQAHETTRLKEAEENALKRITEAKSQEEKRQKDADDYFKSEMTVIESNKTLNPTGEKVDPNKLLKFVIENSEQYNLIDAQGRWNWKAGFALMQTLASQAVPVQNDRKDIAGAITSEPKPESKPANFKTSKDFRGKSWNSI